MSPPEIGCGKGWLGPLVPQEAHTWGCGGWRGFTPRAPIHEHALPVFALLLWVTGQMRGRNALPPSTAQLCEGDEMCSRVAWPLFPAQPGFHQRESGSGC